MRIRLYLFFINVVFLFFTCCFTNPAFSQKGDGKPGGIDEYFSKLPAGLKLVEDVPQKYDITSVINNRDIKGKLINKIILTAKYTRALKGDSVLWNNVRMFPSQGMAKSNAEGILIECMEGLLYKLSGNIVKEEFYKDFPQNETRNLLKTLIWDAATIETFGWNFFHKLELNKNFKPADFDDFSVKMGALGTLKMKELNMTWAGISKRNGEVCALIHYRSFANPVVSATNKMSLMGRSLYWGCIWISLKDKQIEYGTLNEDVVLEMTFPGVPEKRTIDMQREFIFKKAN